MVGKSLGSCHEYIEGTGCCEKFLSLRCHSSNVEERLGQTDLTLSRVMWADGYICDLTNHHGITPPVRVKVPVGPSGPISVCRRVSGAYPRYAALYLLKAFLTNKIVEATVTFRLFEGIGVVRGRGRAKLSGKRMHFVSEKRDRPPAGAFMRERVSLSPLFYRRCSSFTAKSFVS
jgi:hypothetical protein